MFRACPCPRSLGTLMHRSALQIFNNRILHFLDNSSDTIELIRDNDLLVAYRLPKDSETSSLVVFMHEQVERHFLNATSSSKMFGIPLVARISDLSRGSEIRREFLKLLNSFLMPVEDSLNEVDNDQNSANEDIDMEDVISSRLSDRDVNSDSGSGDDSHLGPDDFQFYLMEERGGLLSKVQKMQMNEIVTISELTRPINVLQGEAKKALEVLQKPAVPIDLQYKFAPDLIMLDAYETVESWMTTKNLNPRKLIPAMMRYSSEPHAKNETHEVIKYLEFCVHRLQNEDPGVHSLLLSLYAKQYKFAPDLIMLDAYETVESWMTTKNLNPRKLIPAMMRYSSEPHAKNETHEVIKYLEFCVHRLQNEDPGVHSLLLSLYVKQVVFLTQKLNKVSANVGLKERWTRDVHCCFKGKAKGRSSLAVGFKRLLKCRK
ncbi:hypothetical protein TEA_021558 [Camellia sinensis var. sinensis]|uniref:Uncharacterized protein n=1 Tax=Camellia sinensis var. sinensis TaxID=542762 RepID=A0A4V3WQE4_CAMSN|nr:hypothetical protein TEA_021558 [Camellia sinensis var. sinensis]